MQIRIYTTRSLLLAATLSVSALLPALALGAEEPNSTENEMTDDLAPGWDAIDPALESIYDDAEPMHWGPAQRYIEGGPDPLEGLSAYR